MVNPKKETAPTVIAARKIEDNVKQGKENNLRVDFYNNVIVTHYGAFQLSEIGMDIKVNGNISAGYRYVGADDLLEAMILVGDINGDSKAFLVAKADETTARVFEIEDLFMFAISPDVKQLAVYHNHRPFENKMALLFSNDSPLPFIPDILDQIQDLKLSDFVAGLLNQNYR